MTAKVIKDSSIQIAESLRQWTLNYTDIEDNSNKCYNLEVILDTKNKYYLYSNYGRVGGTLIKEFRPYSSQFEAEKEGEKIIKSKLKKGYVEVALAKADIGSDKAKEKIVVQAIDEVQAKKLGYEVKEENKSALHPKVQGLMSTFFGALQSYIASNLDTKKCSLGQLSLSQINKGRDLLLEARNIIKLSPRNTNELNHITNKYYSNIPMNFGYQRLNAETLRLDSDAKIDAAIEMLETFENAKDAEKVLYKKNAYDEQYQTLKTGIEWLSPELEEHKWLTTLLTRTTASNHHYLKKIRPVNIYKLDRPQECKSFLDKAEYYAKNNIHAQKELPDIYKPLWKDRLKNKDRDDLFFASNTLPLFHGSRTPNFPKILASNLKLPKPEFTISGAAFGSGIYFASNASKSVGYSSFSGSIWTKGQDSNAFLFVANACLGKQKIVSQSGNYTARSIAPAASVWAKAGGYLYNDEFIIFDEHQCALEYIIEFTA